jgi:hypothetical protein
MAPPISWRSRLDLVDGSADSTELGGGLAETPPLWVALYLAAGLM